MLTLRILSIEDVSVYRELRLLSLRESPTAFGSSYEQESVQDRHFFEERITPADGKWVMGAFAEDGLIGTTAFVRDGGMKTRHKGFIWGMYVHPDWRGRGIGRQLMVATLDRADRLPGLRCVRLSVTEHNTAAEKLYASLGFVRYGTESEALCVEGIYHAEHHLVRRVPLVS